MLDRWAERKVVTFPKVPFPMTAKKSKSVGRALGREKTANHPINLLMLNQNTPVYCNPLENRLNLSTFQMQNLILMNVYRNSGKIDWLWVCWRSQVDVIVGGRLWPLLEDKQVWGKTKDFLSERLWFTDTMNHQRHSMQSCAGPEELGPKLPHPRNRGVDSTLVWPGKIPCTEIKAVISAVTAAVATKCI